MDTRNRDAVVGDNIRRARRRAGLSHAVAAGLAGHTQSWLSRVEAGQVDLTGRLVELMALARTCRVPITELIAGTGMEDALHPMDPVPAFEGLDVPWTPEGSLYALRTITESGDMERREFLTVTGVAVTGLAYRMLTTPAVASTGQVAGSTVTDRTVDGVERVVLGLRDLDNQCGGLRVTYQDPLRYVTGLLDRGTYTDAVGRRLHGAAAELLRLCGWVSYDCNQHPQAQRYWTVGLHAAKAAGDTAMGSHLLASMAAQALHAGRRAEAVTLAETAQKHYTGISPRVLARLHLQAAKAYVAARDNDRCRREMTAAENLVPHLDETHPAWASWLDEGVVVSDTGHCYAQLGDTTRAISDIQRGLDLHRGYPRDEALFQSQLAEVGMRQRKPDLDLTLSAGNRALDLLEGVSSPRCASKVRALIPSVSAYSRHNPAAREFVARARELRDTA